MNRRPALDFARLPAPRYLPRQDVSRTWMIDLFQAMQAFVKVADAGCFAQAAAQLGRSKSVVMRHVASLEQHPGIRLFQRTTR